MNHRRIQISIAVVLMGLLLIGIAGCGGDDKSADANTAKAPSTDSAVVASTTTGGQTTCPVMGAAIKDSVSTDYKGKKVYFCCPECIGKFNAEPEKYTAKLPQFK